MGSGFFSQDNPPPLEQGEAGTGPGNVVVQEPTGVDGATSSFFGRGASPTLQAFEEDAKQAAEAAAASAEEADGSATAAAGSATAAANSASAADTSADQALASANAAAGSATSAATSASNATGSATSAAGSATTATTKAAEAVVSANAASTSATNAATSASTATTKAAEASTSATAAAGSATSAAGSATTATTKASEASTSATNAAASATSAGTSASTATTKAAEAATSATNAAASATAASGSASSASTSATNAGASATAASGSAASAAASATTATTKAAEASTSATSAAGSAATATTKAAEASTSATNAAGSATTATTKAAEASTSATNAAGSATAAGTSATSAGTSATNAATSATAASGSATAAAGSATAASGSATAAASAQTAAEAARDSALAAYDQFDDRYLGTKTSDPTLDNDGNALVAGALYFNSTQGVMRLYTGSAWTAAYVSGAGVLLISNNLSDLASASAARANLGLATVAASGAYADLTGKPTISSADGSVVVTGTTNIDLSVAVAGATSNVLLPVRNTTGATLTKGTAVYISGVTGQISTVSKAIATSDSTSAQTLGLITADIPNNSNGNVTLIGTITNINTSAYTDGQQLYLSPTTAGTLTATKPYAPQHLVYMAVVEHAHPSQGKLFVKVQNGYEMDELHDVSAQSPANNDGLFYNTSTSLWEKKSIPTALGYTPYNATNPAGYTTNTGTVTSVSGTGTVSGLTLTGSVTGSGSLTLGGTLSLTSGNVTTALGFTPYNATNPAGYITGITSGNVTTALGYTPANKAGDTFTGTVNFGGGSLVASDGGIRARFNNGNTGAVYFGSGDNYLYYDATQFILWGGYVSNANSFRAPIFYDSNDTSYYVDPNGNSVLNALYMRNGSVQAKFAQASNFGYSSSYRTVILGNEYQTTISMGVDVSGNASGSFNGQGEGREVLFRNGVAFITPNAANTAYETPLTLLNGYASSVGSFRAPIFYDSDNTGYYLDPNGTSNLYRTNGDGFAANQFLCGTTNYGDQVSGSTWYGIGRSNVTGWTAGGMVQVAAYTGLRLRGNYSVIDLDGAVGGDLINFSTTTARFTGDVRATIFYDVSNTGYYIDPASTSNLSGIIVNGTLDIRDSNAQFWRSTNGAYQRVDTRTEATSLSRAHWYGVNSSGGTSNYRHAWYDNAAYFNVTAQDGEIIFERTTGETIVRSTGSFRAPIFYDSNNTAYYVDPASSTALFSDGVVVAGTQGFQSRVYTVGARNRIWSFNNADGYGISYFQGTAGTISADTIGFHFGTATAAASTFQVIGNNYTLSLGSMRSPLFYDSDNTAYYTDPASTSNLRGLTLTDGSAAMTFSSTSSGRSGAFGMTDSYNMYLNAPTNGVLYLSSFQAPIMYDRDNSAYYVDPNGTSNLLGLSVTNRISGSISGDAQRLFNHTGANNDGLQFWNTVGNSTLNPNTGWHYALRLAHGDADTYYNATLAIDFFADNVWLRRKQGGTDLAWKRFALYDNGYAAPFYASIYYDAENTAYYLDPNSTGTSLNVAGSIVAAGNVTAYSDIRIKANVETIPSALDKLDQIRGVTYTRTDLDDKEQRYAGVIAQEIEAVLPEAVRDLGNIKAVDYNATIALLIQAVKELQTEVETVKSRLH